MVKNRLEQLAKDYLTKAITNKNPLILESLEEYNRFAGGRDLNIPTLYDRFKDSLNATFEK
jgi:hypothetical protein